VLSSYLPGTTPRELRFLADGGRPELAPPFDASGLVFNLAHTHGLVVLAVARNGPLGIDVENYDKRVPLEVARRYFSRVESDALQALPGDAQPRRFLRLWTLKESYLKALGTGIAGGLESMTFHIDDAGNFAFERPADLDASRWSFSQFDVGARHVVAVARLPARESRGAVRVEWREFGGGATQASTKVEPLLGSAAR